jgi:hypothetical protein
MGGAPKSAKTMGGEPRRSDEGISAKRRLAGTAGDYAAPPEDVRTIGGAPKNAKTMGGAPKTPKAPEYMDRYAKTIGRAPEDVRTIGGAPKLAKTMGGEPKAPKGGMTMGSVSPGAKTIGGAPKGAKTMGSVSPGAKTMGNAPKAAKTMGSVSPGAKTISSAVKAMKGVPVASKKPMIGQFKTGGYVSKSTFKW